MRGVLQQCWWSLTAWLHCAMFFYKIITATPTIQFSLSRPPSPCFFFVLFFCKRYDDLPDSNGNWAPPESGTVQHHLQQSTHILLIIKQQPIYQSIYMFYTCVHADFLYSACVVLFWGEATIYCIYSQCSLLFRHQFSMVLFFLFAIVMTFFCFRFFAFEMPRETKNPIK